MQNAQYAKVGLLNDLHYAGGAEARNRLAESVAQLNHGGAELLVVMGDLVDGESAAHAQQLLREVSALCGSFHGSVRYMPGNHDLDHLSKAQFYDALGCGGETSTFRCALGGFSFIGIDGNFSPDGREYDCGNFDWKASFVPAAQLVWLEKQLAAAPDPAIVLSHQRVDLDCMHAVQNHAAVREALQRSGKVTAVFHGHQHADDLRNIDGIVYYTLSAHKNGAGPAMLHLAPDGLRLIRDFNPQTPA